MWSNEESLLYLLILQSRLDTPSRAQAASLVARNICNRIFAGFIPVLCLSVQIVQAALGYGESVKDGHELVAVEFASILAQRLGERCFFTGMMFKSRLKTVALSQFKYVWTAIFDNPTTPDHYNKEQEVDAARTARFIAALGAHSLLDRRSVFDCAWFLIRNFHSVSHLASIEVLSRQLLDMDVVQELPLELLEFVLHLKSRAKSQIRASDFDAVDRIIGLLYPPVEVFMDGSPKISTSRVITRRAVVCDRTM